MESTKSNGTPTSGIVDDDEDPFSDANDLNSPSFDAKTEVKQIDSDVKHAVRHYEQQFENNHKATRWSNVNESHESESANHSAIDHSFNLTAAEADITVDSIKEHLSNLDLNHDVDLLLDINNGKREFGPLDVFESRR